MRGAWTIPGILVVAACGGQEAERFSTSGRAVASTNGITRNGITRNGITRNGITRNGLGEGEGPAAIVGAGIDGADFSVEDAEMADVFMRYLVSCALRSDQSASVTINDVTSTYEGALGLSPEWRSSACDDDCQHWNTACLLARTNAYGTEVSLSMRSSTLPSTLLERLIYSQQEGAFFGNLFAEQPTGYACMGRMFDLPIAGRTIGRMAKRVCADTESPEECPLVDLGPCRNFISPPWTLVNERTCTIESFGVLDNCGDHLGLPSFPEGTVFDTRVITTYLDPLTPVWWVLD